MKVTGLVTAYLFAFVVARFFGAQAWGEFSLALSIILFGAILGTAGMDIAIVKIAASRTDSQSISTSYKPAFICISLFSIGASILIYFASEWISGTLFSNPDLAATFKLAAFAILPMSIINLNAGILQGVEKINKYIFIRFVARHVTALLFLLTFTLLWNDSRVVLISYILGLYLVAALSFYWMIGENIRPAKQSAQGKKTGEYSRLSKLSLPLMFAGSLIFLNGWIDTIMVGAFLTEQHVGIYNISLKISGLILLVLTSVNVVVTPKFSKLYSQNNFDKLKNIVQYSTSLIFYLSLPLFIILILFPEEILSIFGNEFTSGKYSLMILCIGSLFSILAGSVGYFMQMTDSQIAFQNITLASTVLGFLLNLLLIPAYGIEGAAIATCTATIFWNVAGVLFIKYKYKINTYYSPFYRWIKD